MNTNIRATLLIILVLAGLGYLLYGWIFISSPINIMVTGKKMNVYESRVCSTETTSSKCISSKEESYIIYTDLKVFFLTDQPQEVSTSLVVFDKVEIGKRYTFLANGWPCCLFISEILDEGQ